ncbi:MAG: PHB depolymerase family esterase [Flavobacteriales bacterium]|nr:PHB depolymerase family esterase [Flavobacteriales bacterium]
MKWIAFILTLTAFSTAFSQDLTPIDDFGDNPGNLKLYTYIPKNLNTAEPVPLVLVLHGCTQSADMISRETGWNKLADSLNFIVIYPEQKQINNGAKCFNFFMGFEAKKDKGEVASIRTMIDYCFMNFKIDSSKVFITGMSAGGAMSNAMLNAYPELFNAGALLAAPSKIYQPDMEPIQPRVAILQGDKDLVVIPRHARKITEQWTIKHHIDITKTETKKEYLNNPLLTATFYYNKENQLKLVSIFAEGLKHKLPIKPGTKITQGGEMDFHTVDINFHSTYWVAGFFGLVE